MKNPAKKPLSAQAKNVLGRYGWLSLQDEEIKQAMFEIGFLRTVEAGQTLFTAGDGEAALHALVSGWQDVLVSPWTESPTLIHVSGPATWGGGLQVMTPVSRRATVVTRTRCQVAWFKASDVRAIGQRLPQMAASLGFLSTLYTDWLVSIVAAQAERKAGNRVRLTLLRVLGEGTPEGGPMQPDPILLPLGQSEISEMSLLTRNVVGPCLKQLEEEGAIKMGYRSIEVLDRNILRRLD